MEEGNINTKEYWNINYSQGFYQDNSVAEWEFNHTFLKNVLPKQPCKILEVAAGLAHNAKYAADLGHTVVATDFSQIAIDESKQRFKGLSEWRLKFLCMSVEEATEVFRQNDVVMAFEFLEHFIDPTPIILKINKALRAGGMFVFSVPNEGGHFAEYHQHYFIFNYKNTTELMFKAGFKQVIFNKNDFNKERILGVVIK